MEFESYKYTFRINASHANVTADEGVHNHTFEISLYIKQRAESFTVYEVTESIVQDYLKPYSGVVLNKIPPFDNISPTVENIGEEFFTEISLRLIKTGYELVRLDISENPQRIYSISEADLSEPRKMRLAVSKNIMEQTVLNAPTDKAAVKPEIIPGESEGKKSGQCEFAGSKISEESRESKNLRISGNQAEARDVSSSSGEFENHIQEKTSSKWWFILSVMLMIVGGYAVMTAVRLSGMYPLGLDIHGHLFKTDLLYHEIMKGNFYPLYTQYWYNGLQPFRYWPPLTYYLMALFQFIAGGNVLNAYLGFIWAVFSIGGIGWVIFARKLGRPALGAFFGIVWFMLPDNLRVLFGEGNLARVFITMLLPYLLYCLWQFVCYRRKKMIFPLILLMLAAIMGHLMISAMIGVASAIFLLIYSIANKRWKESVTAILAMLFSFAVAGVWVYPSLVGGLTSMASDGTSALMASLSAKLSVSLNPFLRLGGGVTELYFGLSIAVIALLGVFLSNRKSMSGFCIMVIIILGTTTALTPLIQLLPLSQLFWVRRFTPIAYAMFVIAMLEWKSLKKPILVLMCAAIFLDAVPSANLTDYDLKMNIPATVDTLNETMDSTLLSQAKKITKQRVSLMDLSILGPLPSYAFGTLDQKTNYVFGWAWQGAATAKNIAYLNESLEKKNYLYMFDRNLELGADTVIIDKLQISSDLDREALLAAAERVGYKIAGETERTILFSYDVASDFGVISRYEGLAIGTTAALVPGILPSFHPGDKENIDDYSLEELEQYNMIYLSGFFYKDKTAAENLVRKIAESGVKVYVDMSRIPADPLTNRMTFLDISAQPITFNTSYPELISDQTTTKANPFAEGYEKWNTVYLTGLSKTDGFAWFEDTKLDFVGTGDTPNITFLGFNLLFHAYTADDPGVKSVLGSLMELDEEKLPDRKIVPLEITYETNKIIIKSEYDNVNTTIAWQDNFTSAEKISSMNNLLIVNKGITVITMEYPYLVKGIAVSAIGVLLEAAIIHQIFKKRKNILFNRPSDDDTIE